MKNIDLTKGNIAKNIYKFTVPIVGTSFIHITYNFVDMICIGKLGSGSVAAVGTAGFFLWLINASASMARIGTSVLVPQEYAKKDYEKARGYFEAGFWTNIVLGLIVSLILCFFNKEIIGFFKLGNEKIIWQAREYTFIIALSIPFMYANPIISSMFNSIGNSKLPFLVNSMGLVFNIVFDILLIFGIGFFPPMGVKGAAIATALAQVLVFVILIYNSLKLKDIRLSMQKPGFDMIIEVCKLGFPSALQSSLYCLYSIILARIIANFGEVEIAVQKVGGQIESISWMTADGLAIAVTAFVGQNFGIKNFKRIQKGIKIISLYAFILGILSTYLLVFHGDSIFKIFIDEAESIKSGANYLKILGYSQLFMCFEILFIGAFSGYGQTRFPAFISIVLTGLRVPTALLLSKTSLGIDGIWLTISGTTIAKGILIPSVFFIYNKKVIKKQFVEEGIDDWKL